MKKILLTVVALGAVAVSLVGLSAFEAHVINVTARIENALQVPLEAINFGTVFPQEELEKNLSIALSGSFMTENRVDDVEYIIRQKPKCGVTNADGTQIVGPTWTGHVVVTGTQGEFGYYVDCNADAPDQVVQDPNNPELWLLPSLCQYISKHPDGVDDEEEISTNDGSLNSFHQPFTINANGGIDWKDVDGRLAKSDNDTTDNWTIDLTVPCFGGFCAQDWADFVDGVNPGADPDLYTQPISNEHKVFGCNLWVEVTEVSEARP